MTEQVKDTIVNTEETTQTVHDNTGSELPTNEPTTSTQPMNLSREALLKLPAVVQLIEDVRKQEKDKLYKTLQAKDETISQLKNTIEDLEKQIKDREDKSLEGEQKLLAEIQQLRAQQEQLIKDMQEKEEQAKKAKLEAFKAQKIKEANGELIEDLVGGETEEEILESIEKAKAKYQEVVSPYLNKMKELEEQVTKPSRSNAPKVQNPTNPAKVEFTSEQIRNMTPSEYAKYREQLLKLIKQ